MSQGNVLLITADQWRGDCLGALAHPCLRTPNLDRLAASGTLFRRHYSQASPCGPGRASLYTGLYAHNHRSVVNGTPLDARHTNVALEARKAGYQPALFGYTDTSADPRRFPRGDPALRTYEGVLPGTVPVVQMTGEMLPWMAELRARGYRLDPGNWFEPVRDCPGAGGRGATYAPARFRAEHSAAAFLTREVIKYLSVREGAPWFVHLSYLSPHPPFIAPEPYHALYDPGDAPAPVRAASADLEGAQHPYLEFYLHHQRDDPYSFGKHPRDNLAIDDRELAQIRATYYGMMSEVDAQVGELLRHLERSGAAARTLVVFTSDHGEQLGDHWQLSKCAYFEQSFHVPLIVRDPRAPGGQVVDAFTEAVDVMPTVLEWLGLAAPVQCDGRSLAPLCRGERVERWREAAHYAFDFRNFRDQSGAPPFGLAPDECAFLVRRERRWKLVHFTSLAPLLFDLETDPGELHDLASSPEHRSVLLAMTQKLLSFRLAHEDRTLANIRLTPEGPVEHRPAARGR